MNRGYKILLCAFVAALPLLMAPTGGYPSRPKFQSVTVSGACCGDPAPIMLRSTVPGIAWFDTDGTVNARRWDLHSNTGSLNGRLTTDANTSPATWLSVAGAAGPTISSINLQATAVQANGVPVVTAAPEAAGGTFVGRLVSMQFKGGNTDRTNTAVLANDPTIAGLSIPAAGTYLIDSQLCFVGPASGAGGIQFRYAFTGTTTGSFIGFHSGSVNSVVQGGGGYLALNANSISFGTITSVTANDCIIFRHTLNASSSGTVALMWAQAASNANATRLSAGSAVWITRLG